MAAGHGWSSSSLLGPQVHPVQSSLMPSSIHNALCKSRALTAVEKPCLIQNCHNICRTEVFSVSPLVNKKTFTKEFSNREAAFSWREYTSTRATKTYSHRGLKEVSNHDGLKRTSVNSKSSAAGTTRGHAFQIEVWEWSVVCVNIFALLLFLSLKIFSLPWGFGLLLRCVRENIHIQQTSLLCLQSTWKLPCEASLGTREEMTNQGVLCYLPPSRPCKPCKDVLAKWAPSAVSGGSVC